MLQLYLMLTVLLQPVLVWCSNCSKCWLSHYNLFLYGATTVLNADYLTTTYSCMVFQLFWMMTISLQPVIVWCSNYSECWLSHYNLFLYGATTVLNAISLQPVLVWCSNCNECWLSQYSLFSYGALPVLYVICASNVLHYCQSPISFSQPRLLS